MEGNHVQQDVRHAFAGIQFGVHSSTDDDSFHNDTLIAGNTIVGNGSLSLGLVHGARPWFRQSWVSGGEYVGNEVSGAVVNLLVDGARSGVIRANNVLHDPAGNPRCPEPPRPQSPVNYNLDPLDSVGVVSLLTPDATRDYDGCIP